MILSKGAVPRSYKLHFVDALKMKQFPNWYANRSHLHPSGSQVFVTVLCDKNHLFLLSREIHTISDYGKVCPSVVCPVKGCGFHEVVTLEGWRDHDQG